MHDYNPDELWVLAAAMSTLLPRLVEDGRMTKTAASDLVPVMQSIALVKYQPTFTQADNFEAYQAGLLANVESVAAKLRDALELVDRGEGDVARNS